MRSHIVVLSVAVASIIALTPACPGADTTGEGEGEGEGGGPATPEQTADAFAALIARCINSGFEAESEPTLSALLAAEESDALKQIFLDQITSPNVTFDQSKAGACIAVFNSISCDELFSSAEPPACAAVTTGKLAADDACAFNTECAPGLTCHGSGGTACGTCAATVGLNDDCSNADCGDNLSCDNGTCVTPPAPVNTGDACDDQNGVFCSQQGDLCTNSVCTTPTVVQVGDACDNELLHCLDTATKNVCLPDGQGATTSTCTARPGVGGDCSTLPLCDATVAVCTAGSCVAGGADGDACDDTQAQPCQAQFSCTDATCQNTLAFTAPPTCP